MITFPLMYKTDIDEASVIWAVDCNMCIITNSYVDTFQSE